MNTQKKDIPYKKVDPKTLGHKITERFKEVENRIKKLDDTQYPSQALLDEETII